MEAHSGSDSESETCTWDRAPPEVLAERRIRKYHLRSSDVPRTGPSTASIVEAAATFLNRTSEEAATASLGLLEAAITDGEALGVQLQRCQCDAAFGSYARHLRLEALPDRLNDLRARRRVLERRASLSHAASTVLAALEAAVATGSEVAAVLAVVERGAKLLRDMEFDRDGYRGCAVDERCVRAAVDAAEVRLEALRAERAPMLP